MELVFPVHIDLRAVVDGAAGGAAARRAGDLLNLQPAAAIDYDYLNGMGDRGRMTGEWLSHCQACSVPEVACVFNRWD